MKSVECTHAPVQSFGLAQESIKEFPDKDELFLKLRFHPELGPQCLADTFSCWYVSSLNRTVPVRF